MPFALHTETLCYSVGGAIVAKYGSELTKEAARAGIGKRPVECWQVIIDKLDMSPEATAQKLFDETEPLLQARCAAT